MLQGTNMSVRGAILTMRKPATLSLSCLGLLAAAHTAVAVAAEGESAELDAVVVTGSRIPTLSKEGPSPVTVISSADIASRGFTTVQEAIAALTLATGLAQNETQLNGLTQNANSANVRGLGPGRTLVLVDGRRITDYPLPYNGQSNFVNLSAIPAAAVDRIEILAGGASAIYGSDAVAGVINIILKDKSDTPLDLNLRYGDTTQGGGESLRLQGVTSFKHDRFSALFAAEIFKRDPIYAFQRNFQDSVQDNPDPAGRANTRSIMRMDPFDLNEDGLGYVAPETTACNAFSGLVYSFREDYGYYCGTEFGPSQYTIRNARERGSLYSSLSYQLDSAELYGSLNFFKSKDRLDPDLSFFRTDFIIPEWYFFDVSEDPDGYGGNYAHMQRLFQPYEFGGYKARQERFREQVIDYAVGVRGDLQGTWRYDFTVSGSEYDLKRRRQLLLNQPLMDYFLGPQLEDGGGNPEYDPYVDTYPVYSARWDRFYTPVTPEIYRSFTDTDASGAKSYNRSATLVFTGDLMQLPAGPLATALVVEAAKQHYDITLDEQFLNGEFFGVAGTGGGGSRKRQAAGLELGIPLLQQLRMKLAGRYDNYNDITAVNGAFTYNVGLEYRPIRQLLLRGDYATSFRAPDMHYVFADASNFFSSVKDEYLCRRDQPGSTLAACTITSGDNLEVSRQGNPFLKEETSDSWTAGLVVQPVPSVTLSVDYYDIKLKGAVLDDSAELLLQTEADCRLGETRDGDPVDTNSISCQSALARVSRRPAGGATSEFLDTLATGPINTAMIHTAGLDAAAGWKIGAGSWGEFDLRLAYTQVLKYDQQDYAGDAVRDVLDDLKIWDWHSRINASLGWTKGPFTSTLFLQRDGSVPNWAETGRIGSHTTANLTARYSGLMDGKVYVGLAVQNLFDRNPPHDPTFDVYPFYSAPNYNPVGREVFVEVGARF